MRRHAYVLVLAGLLTLVLWSSPGVALCQGRLEKVLPDAKCSLLHHHRLKGQKLWRHWIWHLDRSEYGRICATIRGESNWHPREVNDSSGATGLCQFMPGWYNGVWWPYHFDAKDPITSIRVMVYIIRHPQALGGWSNWAGH